jgi:hypothetical protein
MTKRNDEPDLQRHCPAVCASLLKRGHFADRLQMPHELDIRVSPARPRAAGESNFKPAPVLRHLVFVGSLISPAPAARERTIFDYPRNVACKRRGRSGRDGIRVSVV